MSKLLHPEGTSPQSLAPSRSSLSQFSVPEARFPFFIAFCVPGTGVVCCNVVTDAFWVVLWAQRSSETDEEKNIVYLSVNAVDLQNPKVELTASGVTVEGVQKGTEATYKASLEFYEDINLEVPQSLSHLCPPS